MLTVRELAERTRGLDQGTFVRAHPRPALLTASSEVPSPEGRVDTPSPTSFAKTSQLIAQRSPLALPDDRPTRDEAAAFVHFLEKSARNPFANMITIGRALNNDIIVADGAVSKLHAYFYERPEGLFLVDSGSTNGTTLNGERLMSREERRLADGDAIQLSPTLELRLYLPESLFALLRSIGGKKR